jgi:beta-phosphoglucomutase-like phosphatase (HAD superfamily)
LSRVAVIFDCDGTLVDSELLCNVVLADTLRDLGIAEQAAELLGRYRGGRMANILMDLEQRHALRLPPDFEGCYRAPLLA